MVAIGVVLLAVGVVGVQLTLGNHENLSGYLVSSPAPGMLATAIGDGGALSTYDLPGSVGGVGIKASGTVPTTPTLYLQPAPLTNFGISDGTEAAYWKVWWNGTTQVKAVVSLQAHVSAGEAADTVVSLDNQFAKTANFDSADLNFATSSTFDVPGIPGADGYLWEGTEGSGTSSFPIELRFAIFSRGDVVALASMTAYSGTTDLPSFFDFAQSEYAALPAEATVNTWTGLFGLVFLGGIVVLIIGIVQAIRGRRRRPPAYAGGPQGGPWPGPYPGAPPPWPPPGMPPQGAQGQPGPAGAQWPAPAPSWSPAPAAPPAPPAAEPWSPPPGGDTPLDQPPSWSPPAAEPPPQADQY
jgi:hypothetical protein